MDKVYFKPGTELTFNSVVKVRAKLYQALMAELSAEFCLDLCEVTQCDSAGLALLIEARKLCIKNNKVLKIIGMPAETHSLAEFFGVKNILVQGAIHVK